MKHDDSLLHGMIDYVIALDHFSAVDETTMKLDASYRPLKDILPIWLAACEARGQPTSIESIRQLGRQKEPS